MFIALFPNYYEFIKFIPKYFYSTQSKIKLNIYTAHIIGVIMRVYERVRKIINIKHPPNFDVDFSSK